MKHFKLILLIIFAVIVLLLVVQNTALMQTRFLWMTVEFPAIVVLLVTALASFLSGILVALLKKPKITTTPKKEENFD